MKRNNILTVSSLIMIMLAFVIVFLGFTAGPRVMLPPIITGAGFLVIAWVFWTLKEK